MPEANMSEEGMISDPAPTSMTPDPGHQSVLLDEVLTGLNLQAGASAIDCTLGGGGHTAHILARTAPTGRVLGLDADPDAIERVSRRFATEIAAGRLRLVQSAFEELAEVAEANDFSQVDGIL